MAASEVSFEAIGKRWHFKFGFGAICTLEESYDLPFIEVIGKVFPEIGLADLLDPEKIMAARANVRFSVLRTVFQAGLDAYHPDVTKADVNNIIDDLGIEGAGDIIKKAVTQDLGGGDNSENPPARLNG